MVRDMEKNGAGKRFKGSGNEEESPFHVGALGSLLNTRGISGGRALPAQCKVNAKALRQERS